MTNAAETTQTAPETATETLSWTTDPVDLHGVEPADPPTELVPGKLWHGGCPVDFRWARGIGIDVVLDLADADAYPWPRRSRS